MKIINNWVTKKKVLIISGTVSVLLLIINYVGTYQLCGGGIHDVCIDYLSNMLILFSPVIPLFVLSAIVYFLREEIFNVWIKFVYVWIPLTAAMILIAPEYGNAFLPIEKGTVATFFSLVFVIVSVVIMVVKSISTKKTG